MSHKRASKSFPKFQGYPSAIFDDGANGDSTHNNGGYKTECASDSGRDSMRDITDPIHDITERLENIEQSLFEFEDRITDLLYRIPGRDETEDDVNDNDNDNRRPWGESEEDVDDPAIRHQTLRDKIYNDDPYPEQVSHEVPSFAPNFHRPFTPEHIGTLNTIQQIILRQEAMEKKLSRLASDFNNHLMHPPKAKK